MKLLTVVFLGLCVTAESLSYTHEDAESRIKGGQLAANNSRPYQAVIITEKNDDPMKSKVCSVVLVKKNYVASTTTCYFDTGNEVYLGTNKWCMKSGEKYSYDFDLGYQKRTIKKVLLPGLISDETNPLHGSMFMRLGELDSPVDLNDRVQLATFSNNPPSEGDSLQVSGWGATERRQHSTQSVFGVAPPPAPGPSCDLMEADAPVVNRVACKDAWSQGEIRNDEFCAGYLTEGPTSCDFDEGSPIVKDGVIYGMARKTDECGQSHSTHEYVPSLYMNTTSHIPWIKEKVGDVQVSGTNL